MVPACSTAQRRFGSAAVDEIPVSAPRPLAYGWSESCCCWADAGVASAAARRNDTSIHAKVPAPPSIESGLYGLLRFGGGAARWAFHTACMGSRRAALAAALVVALVAAAES